MHPLLFSVAIAAHVLTGQVQPAPPTLAVAEGLAITPPDLTPSLHEMAGGQALEEAILDRLLARELEARSLTLDPSRIDAERALLDQAIADEARADAAQTQRLLESMRRSRGLGPRRFAALLWRNAALRALVAPEVSVSDEDVTLALELAFGPKVQARLLVVGDERQAAEIHARLSAAPDTLASQFTAEAFRSSIDATGSRGGLLPEFHDKDPEIPASLRAAARALEPGSLSPVFSFPNGYALLYLEARIPATTTPGQAEADAARTRLRRRVERQAMERLAADLLAQAKVTVFDDSLRWSWETRPTR